MLAFQNEKGKKSKKQEVVVNPLDINRKIFIPNHELDTYGTNKGKLIINYLKTKHVKFKDF